VGLNDPTAGAHEVVAGIGTSLNLLSQASAAALIGAAQLSALLFPAVALALRPWTTAPVTGVEPEGRGPTGAAVEPV
jgi:hypothetical protein